MRTRSIPKEAACLLAAACLAAGTPTARAEDAAPEALQAQIEEILRQNREMQQRIRELEHEVQRARDDARAARDEARNEAGERSGASGLPRLASTGGSAPGPAGARDGALLSRSLGRANLQLLDVSLDVLAAAGSSEADDGQLEALQGGEHDPRQRGFTLQQVELSLLGAVDPYMTGEAHLIYFLDTEGESRFELEEAFLTSQRLPFGLEGEGLQVEAGHFFTEFGRLNPLHPHAWDWQDQPVILSRLFGGDGIRAPGVRVGWLTPLPWYSELHLGMQNAKGETMVSFLANDEVFEERPIGGRPFTGREVSKLEDFVYLTRWVNGFDVSDTVSTQLGASLLLGPNPTGDDANTRITGADWVVKWRPLATDRGWPFVTWQSEFLFRSYQAESFLGCPEPEEDDACTPVAVDGETFEDWGLYTQLLWGFRRGWAAGLRYEYAGGSGDGVSLNDAGDAFVSTPRSEDPFRADRHRVSPLLAFHPSEFSRLRLQYNYDHADHLSDEDVHSVWAGVELLFGAHAAHSY